MIFLANFIISELIMSEVSKDLRNIFFPKIPRILELEVGFFSTKKKFFQDFFLPENLFHLNFISKKKKNKTFLDRPGGRAGGTLSVAQELIISSSGALELRSSLITIIIKKWDPQGELFQEL